MLIKTQYFVKKLNSKLYQYSFNKKQPLSLKGSFQYTTYISDIDFTAYVYFNDTFIKILIHKIKNLKDFRFMYLNAGSYDDLKVPWVIYSEGGCDFNLENTKIWFNHFKLQNIIRIDSYDQIERILNKKFLIIGDLIDIQEILDGYKTIRWFLPDIIKGTKTVRKHTYVLLEELKIEEGPVLNGVYIDGRDIVSVDIGLVDKRYRQPIWSRMYKYYTENWYKILKSYKKLISKDYENEYRKVMSTLEYDNALLAEANLLNNLMKYNVVGQDGINYVAQDLKKNLEKEGIKTFDLKEVVNILTTRLNNKSKPYVDYFLDKLEYYGKIKTYQRLRLTELAKILTSRKKLVERRKGGIECPFFESNIDQHINNIASRLMVDQDKWYRCLRKVSKSQGKELDIFVKEMYNKSPVSRLFLQNISKDKIYIRGALTNQDTEVLGKIVENKRNYLSCDSKYMKRLQIYLLTGY